MSGIGVSLDFHASPPQTCRVSLNQPCQVDRLGVTNQGDQTFVTPTNVVYHQYGIRAVDASANLGVYQQRPYLMPEYYNGGCFGEYCKDATQCPTSKPVQSSPATKQMFDLLFNNLDPLTGNDAPPACFQGKLNFDGTGCTYDSVKGWELNKQGQLCFTQPGANVIKQIF